MLAPCAVRSMGYVTRIFCFTPPCTWITNSNWNIYVGPVQSYCGGDEPVQSLIHSVAGLVLPLVAVQQRSCFPVAVGVQLNEHVPAPPFCVCKGIGGESMALQLPQNSSVKMNGLGILFH